MMKALDNDYCVTSEERDYQMFVKWNGINKYFSTFSRTGKGDAYDVVGTLVDGRECAVELKYRTATHDEFDTWLIEPDKLADGLLYATLSGMTALYINFYSDGWTGVFDLTKQHNISKQQKQRRTNPGFGDKMVEHAAYHLNKNDGVFFDESGRIYRNCV